jgi:homocysteine S-methyltransferase
MLEAVRPMVQGVQVAAPFGRYSAAAEVIASVLPEATFTGAAESI